MKILAQERESFSRRNTWSFGAEYSNNSNRLLVGASDQRKWASVTLGYSRRVFNSHGVEFAYLGEVRPLVLESDPVTTTTFSATEAGVAANGPLSITSIGADCLPGQNTFAGTDPSTGHPEQIAISTECSRRWTYGGAISPAGFRLNGFTGRRVQPVLLGTLGVLWTTRPIPAQDGTQANFLIQIGAGLEMYPGRSRESISLEYRVQHISNDDRSTTNPGIDSQVVHVAWQFGR